MQITKWENHPNTMDDLSIFFYNYKRDGNKTFTREINLLEIKELKLGNITIPNNVLMAPLAGYTCYPFRMLCRELGAGLCYTEMISCNGLKYKDKATQRLLFTTEKEEIKAAQLLGQDPRIMEKMARSGDVIIPEGVTAIAGGAFYGNRGITSVKLPESLKRIGSRAFWGCTSLKENGD